MFGTEIVEPVLQPHSAKVFAESFGISGLPDDVAEFLSEDTTERLKEILQCAFKFMEKGKRTKLSVEDFDSALKFKNFEPFYGFSAPDLIPFRYASGGGREIFFTEEKELELNEIINAPNPKYPLDVTLKAHWLSIEGVQPAVPENPIIASSNEESGSKFQIDKKSELAKLRRHELVNVRSLSTHDISVEQQLYFKEVTEGAVGSDENKRMEALNSLSTDTGLQPLVPRLVLFISEGVKCNVVQHNLALLIYLMRMVKGLCENPAVNLEKCLHDLLPAVLSGILGSQLCSRPEADNHWALREFAARVLVQICKQYTNHINNLQTRLTQVLAHCWKSDSSSFSTLFGAAYALSELGSDIVKNFLLPKVPSESERIRAALDGSNFISADRTGAEHLKSLLVKILRVFVKTTMQHMNDLGEFRSEFGPYLGSLIHNAMLQAKELTTTAGSSSSVGSQQQAGYYSQSKFSTSAVAGHFRGGASATPSMTSSSNLAGGAAGLGQKVVYFRNSASVEPGTPTAGSGTPTSGGRFFPSGGGPQPPILSNQMDTSSTVTTGPGAGQSMVVVRAIKLNQSRSNSPNPAVSPDLQ